jgi:hypothetical protein
VLGTSPQRKRWLRKETSMKKLLVLLAMALLLAMAVTIPVTATVTVTDVPNPDAYTCSQPGYITFEEYPDQFNLSAGAISGVEFTTTGGYTWLVGDFGTGNYNGKYPGGGYMSEGMHWAWLGTVQGAGRIDFVDGTASYFSLLTSVGAPSPVYLEAYDSSDTLLETAGPAPDNCNTGHMWELVISRPSEDMAYVIVHDTGDYFLVDAICTDAPGVPNPNEIPVPLDIKPMSCPNPINLKDRGVLPVAILGTADFDVTTIDPASVRLEGIAPLRWALEDTATPFEPFLGKCDAYDCTEAGPDGYLDLVLHFKAQEVVAALGEVSDGEVLVLQVIGNLMEDYGGLPIIGEDVVWIISKGAP